MGNKEISSSSDASFVYDLIGRILPLQKDDFLLEKLPSSSEIFFELSCLDNKIRIQGNDNVSLAYGFNYYLRYYLNTSISWCGNNVPQPPKLLPLPLKTIKQISSFPYRYYLNYCTHSYSMAFWDWSRWEREIDWMALHGVNLVLASTGQQAVWRNTMKKMKFSNEAIKKFIPGPAFEAWWLMQNLEGWGGPVSDDFIDERMILQQKIIKRLKELDIEPVLQCFYGMVPRETVNLYPKAQFIDSGKWQGFDRPLFLDPNDDLYDKFSRIYYEEQYNLYGECSFFAGDPFHELAVGKGNFKNLESLNFRKSGSKIYKNLKTFCKEKNSKNLNITWILQAWEGGTQPNSEMLKGLSLGEVLVLDLASNALPQWGGVEGVWSREKKSYEGHNWSWCVLDNFGGVNGIFGRMQQVVEELPKALKHPLGQKKLKGIGATMEGIERNCIVFDLLFDMTWNMENLKIDDWIKMFVSSRYGKENEKVVEAWNILRKSVLSEKNDMKMGCSNIVSHLPKLVIYPISKYEKNAIKMCLDAWKLLIEAREEFKIVDTFQYDLVDLTRQILLEYLFFVYLSTVNTVKMKDYEKFLKNSEEFLELLDILDDLLLTRKEFLLGKWIADAFNLGTNLEEKKLFVWNAKQQITLWGFNTILVDYARKDWSGLVSTFYKPRWTYFFNEIKEKWDSLNFSNFGLNYYEKDKKWVENELIGLNFEPIGDPIEKCHEIFLRIFEKTISFTQSID